MTLSYNKHQISQFWIAISLENQQKMPNKLLKQNAETNYGCRINKSSREDRVITEYPTMSKQSTAVRAQYPE